MNDVIRIPLECPEFECFVNNKMQDVDTEL